MDRPPRNPGYRLLAGVLLLLSTTTATAAPEGADDEGWPAWAEQEEQWRQRVAAVNEGDLVFISERRDDDVHRHASRITITERSLLDGWVLMEQCHEGLDRVDAAEIVFRPGRSRALEVVSTRNIASATAEANAVQLRGIGEDSRVCLRLETLALQHEDPDVFELHNGPFMRRFLDGYYPLRLSLRIDYPATLALADFAPEEQPGFSVRQTEGSVRVEAFFEGRLRTRFRFLAR